MARTLLIVDHVATRRTSLKLLLVQEQYQVLEAASCEAALALIERRRIDVVLTETELPSRSGLFLLKELKRKRPDIEVILLTHNASSYNLLQALRNGAHDFIVRPIDSGEFLFQALERAYRAIQLRQEERQLVIELEVRNRQMSSTLHRMSELQHALERLAMLEDPGELLQGLLDAAVGLVHAERGLLALIGRDGDLAVKLSRGLDQEFCRACAEKIPDGLLSAIFDHGRPILIAGKLPPKLEQKTAAEEREVLFTTPGVLAIPVRSGTRLIGLLVMAGHPRQLPFNEADLQRLTQLAAHAALLLEKAGRIRQLNKQAQQRQYA